MYKLFSGFDVLARRAYRFVEKQNKIGEASRRFATIAGSEPTARFLSIEPIFYKAFVPKGTEYKTQLSALQILLLML
jgi:hypothetical protein